MKISNPGLGKEQSAILVILLGMVVFYGFKQSQGLISSLSTMLFLELNLSPIATLVPSLVVNALIIAFVIWLMVRANVAFKEGSNLEGEEFHFKYRHLVKVGAVVAIITVTQGIMNLFYTSSMALYFGDQSFKELQRSGFYYFQLASYISALLVDILLIVFFIVLSLKIRTSERAIL